MRPHERELCPKAKKLIFNTSAEAEAELEAVRQRRQSGQIETTPGKGVEQRIYPCLKSGGCGRWHLTSELLPKLERLRKR
jgi:hypothetical protein